MNVIGGLFRESTVPMLESVLQFTQTRHSILATNIANLDTPGYQVRDLSVSKFEDQLKRTIEKSQSPAEFTELGEKATTEDEFRKVSQGMEGILYHDGTNLNLETQLTEIAKNQSRHNMAIAVMNNQFRLLQAAISERA